MTWTRLILSLAMVGVAANCTPSERKPIQMSCAPGEGRGPDGNCVSKSPSPTDAPNVTLPPGSMAPPATGHVTPIGGGSPPILTPHTSPGSSGSGSTNTADLSVTVVLPPNASGTPTPSATAAAIPPPPPTPTPLAATSTPVPTVSPTASTSPSPSSSGADLPDEAAPFPADAPVKLGDGAPWIGMKLVRTATGDHQLRLALSHVDDVTELTWHADKDLNDLKAVPVDDGSLQVTPFTVSATISFHFNKTTCRAGPFVVNRYDTLKKPVCQ